MAFAISQAVTLAQSSYPWGLVLTEKTWAKKTLYLEKITMLSFVSEYWDHWITHCRIVFSSDKVFSESLATFKAGSIKCALLHAVLSFPVGKEITSEQLWWIIWQFFRVPWSTETVALSDNGRVVSVTERNQYFHHQMLIHLLLIEVLLFFA